MASLRSWLLLPIARLHWASARDAHKAKKWANVVASVGKMHGCGWRTDESWAALGMAHAHLEQYEEAIEALERIEGTLDLDDSEQARWLNLAASYHHTGCHAKALALLPEVEEIPAKFPDHAEGALLLRESIESALDDSA